LKLLMLGVLYSSMSSALTISTIKFYVICLLEQSVVPLAVIETRVSNTLTGTEHPVLSVPRLRHVLKEPVVSQALVPAGCYRGIPPVTSCPVQTMSLLHP
jgi:hypothetical protein